MADLSRLGGGAIPIGGITKLYPNYPDLVELDGQTFLRSGFLASGDFDSTLPTYELGEFWGTVNREPVGFLTRLVVLNNGDFLGANGSTFLQRSTTAGINWVGINSGFTAGGYSSLAKLPNGNLLAGSSLGQIIRSSNDGISWEQTTNALDMQVLDIISAGGNVALACGIGVNSRVHLSLNNGGSWSPASGSTANIRKLLRLNNGVLLGVGNEGRVIRSTDNGANWTSISGVFPSNTTIQAIIQLQNGDVLSAGNNGQVRRSTNTGLNWTTVDVGLGSSATIRSIFQLSNGNILISSPLTKSEDNGETWRVINPLITDVIIESSDGSLLSGGGTGFVRSDPNSVGIDTGNNDDFMRIL